MLVFEHRVKTRRASAIPHYVAFSLYSGLQQFDQRQSAVCQAYRRLFRVVALRARSRSVSPGGLVGRDRGLQALKRSRNIVSQNGAWHRPTVSHQLEQPDRDVAEHRDVRICVGSKGDQHGFVSGLWIGTICFYGAKQRFSQETQVYSLFAWMHVAFGSRRSNLTVYSGKIKAPLGTRLEVLTEPGKRNSAPGRERDPMSRALNEPSLKEPGPDQLGHRPFPSSGGQLLKPAQLGKTNHLVNRSCHFRPA